MLTLPPVSTVLSSILIQGLSPPMMRARLIALNVLAVNLFGYTVGPQFVGAYLDAAADTTIGGAVAWLAAIAGPLALALFLLTRHRLRFVRDGCRPMEDASATI